MHTCQEEIASWGQKPCNYQLPFSLIYLVNPSATLFPSWQMKTSSRAFFSSSPFLSITASQQCRIFSCLPPFLPSHWECNGTLANNVGKQWAHNCEILFLCNKVGPFFFGVSLYLALLWLLIRSNSLSIPACAPSSFINLLGPINRGSGLAKTS